MLDIFVRLFRQRTLRKIVVALLFISFSLAILIVPLEAGHATAKIHNFGDAIWWMVSTITTVGYGDVVPVTFEGRMLGIILQLMGVVMLSAVIGSLVVQLNRKKDDYQWQKISKKLDQISIDLEEIKKKSDFIILQTGEHKK